MVFVNEWLPRPSGSDAGGEFIELYNDSLVSVSLSGWHLQTRKNKKFFLDGKKIGARGYLVLGWSETKLALRDTDGGLSLYDARGALVEKEFFYGTAPVGKSYSRVGWAGRSTFAFVDPTPGAPNAVVDLAVSVREYPVGVPINRELDTAGFSAIMIGAAALIAGLVFYVLETNAHLSDIFFGRDNGSW